MKTFETPYVEVIKLQVVDVITTSDDTGCDSDMGEF